MKFRTVIFWLHLVAGVVAGIAIGIMCFTGVALAFEKEIVAWAERDVRRVSAPADAAAPLPLEELQRRVREQFPDVRPVSVVVHHDPRAAVAFSAGRTGGVFANPYTGDVRRPASDRAARFMQTMIEWHRYLGFGGEVSRPRGKWINGVCNIAFCLLAITGVYLWMPRAWSWRALRPAVWFTQNSSSRARDWNWHNVIGFWTAPVLIVLTLTAMPISFRWAGNLIHTMTGTPVPAAPAAAAAPVPAVEVPTPPEGSRPLGAEALVAAGKQAVPRWQTITLRVSVGGRERPADRAAGVGGGRPQTAPPVTLMIREKNSWPRTASTTLWLDPYTGTVLKREGYAELNAARQVRAWTRFLHTGEALGWPGQLLAGIASAGGCVLVWTGLALAWRRFFGRRS